MGGWSGSWILVILGSIAILIEIALGGFAGFDLVLVGSALVLGGALGLFLGNTLIGFVSAAILAVLYVLVGRRWVRARMRTHKVPSNVDAVIGAEALVTQRVSRHEPGQVRVKDEVWRAVPAHDVQGPFEPGSVVHVESVEGVTLRVRS
ncbi:MAG TPA: NfeD family protein [Candidatus Eisenbacteria bacterium]|nr:NfeD family protein [Candidatus Eisenbacteria bacterium]